MSTSYKANEYYKSLKKNQGFFKNNRDLLTRELYKEILILENEDTSQRIVYRNLPQDLKHSYDMINFIIQLDPNNIVLIKKRFCSYNLYHKAISLGAKLENIPESILSKHAELVIISVKRDEQNLLHIPESILKKSPYLFYKLCEYYKKCISKDKNFFQYAYFPILFNCAPSNKDKIKLSNFFYFTDRPICVNSRPIFFCYYPQLLFINRYIRWEYIIKRMYLLLLILKELDLFWINYPIYRIMYYIQKNSYLIESNNFIENIKNKYSTYYTSRVWNRENYFYSMDKIEYSRVLLTFIPDTPVGFFEEYEKEE